MPEQLKAAGGFCAPVAEPFGYLRKDFYIHLSNDVLGPFR